MENQYYTQSDVLSRKWTKSMIDKLLGAPDKLRDNPHGRRAAPMKLFLVSRVVAAEQTQDYASALAKAEKRRQSIKPSIDKKRHQAIDEAKELPIDIEVLEKDELIEYAISQYNSYWSQSIGKHADKGADESFIKRISVNYIRHCLTDYDYELHNCSAKIGADEARYVIRWRIFEAIAEAYPHLKDECASQLADRI